ncbi:LysR family transcriptional regulator [Micrococcus luteus]|uniref:LysR family transcriptional regulator n=1 Tax=Micrococcus TaxID=1269 RepID=UPI0019CF657E|nr:MULTISPECIES: LysR family transcriptional regulator [Micrococcus]MBU8761948.1 LysR family transcriptional regulator [Micrococcus luteus]MCV7509238.1 LysR family transcriptional regulator [Micrococcus luteus]MCV7592684.1 LysR family transcriptional regulator [Micrococcus luteus]MCV7604366.1 LysR family transcriptional regulator [Micrococcus luteus]
MEEKLLRAFVTVAEVGTVSGAAIRLDLVQSALSRQLQRLQRELRLPLFARVGGRLELTTAGEAFLPVAREVLVAHRRAEQAARALASGRLTDVAVAAPGTTLIDVVLPFVATFGEEDPRPRVAETQLDDSLLDAVARHDLVVMPTVPPPSVASLPLMDLPVWAYVAPGHPWAGRTRVSLDDLVAQPVVAPARTFMARRVLDGAVAVAGLTPPALTEANSGRVAQALVATGAGVAVVTEDPAFELTPVRVIAQGRALAVQLHAAWREDHFATATLEKIARRLQAFVRDRYAEPGDDAPGRGRSA